MAKGRHMDTCHHSLIMVEKTGKYDFFSVSNSQGNILFRLSQSIRVLDENGPKIKCHFHYFHCYVKLGYYCGVIPFKLIFSHGTGHYQLSRVSFPLKVKIFI